MTVHRTTFLPEGPPVGRLIVPYAVVLESKIVLQGFRGINARHEGMVFWLGRRVGNDAVVAGALLPDCEHGPQRVMTPQDAIGAASRAARNLGLGIVAQLHTHGGDDTRHSDGDDHLVLMPFAGMFSLVVARYGAGGMTLESGIGLHQYQDGQWIRIPKEYSDAITIVPTMSSPGI